MSDNDDLKHRKIGIIGGTGKEGKGLAIPLGKGRLYHSYWVTPG